MARPRKKTFTMSQYTGNVNDGYILNNFKTQRFLNWKLYKYVLICHKFWPRILDA